MQPIARSGSEETRPLVDATASMGVLDGGLASPGDGKPGPVEGGLPRLDWTGLDAAPSEEACRDAPGPKPWSRAPVADRSRADRGGSRWYNATAKKATMRTLRMMLGTACRFIAVDR